MTQHYVVDIWVEDECVTQDELDDVIANAIASLNHAKGISDNKIEYDVVDMSDDD